MADEPFVTPYSGRKRRVQFMAGGKLPGAQSSVPPCDGSCDDYVLTNVAGTPTWRPQAEGPSGSLFLDPGYWLKPKSMWRTNFEMPYNWGMFYQGFTYSSKLGTPAVNPDVNGARVLGTGTGTQLSLALPATIDGQQIVDTPSGLLYQFYGPRTLGLAGPFGLSAAPSVCFVLQLQQTSGPVDTGYMLFKAITKNGEDPTPSNMYTDTFSGPTGDPDTDQFTGTYQFQSAINTIPATQAAVPHFVAKWERSISWRVLLLTIDCYPL